MGQLGWGSISVGESQMIFCFSPTFEHWLCYKVSLIPGWIFTFLEPWIPLSQHIAHSVTFQNLQAPVRLIRKCSSSLSQASPPVLRVEVSVALLVAQNSIYLHPTTQHLICTV